MLQPIMLLLQLIHTKSVGSRSSSRSVALAPMPMVGTLLSVAACVEAVEIWSLSGTTTKDEVALTRTVAVVALTIAVEEAPHPSRLVVAPLKPLDCFLKP